MPVSYKTSTNIDHEKRVIELATWLFHPPEKGQPRIIRKTIGRSGLQDLMVIWEGWKGIPFEERTATILEANDTLEETIKTDVYVAQGLTTDEAIALGYLPFRIEPIVKSSENVDLERIVTAMKEEGGVETSTGLQLRFTSLEEAQEVFVRLQKKVSGPFWMIVQEVLREG